MASDALSTYLGGFKHKISSQFAANPLKQENSNMEKWALFEIHQNHENYCLLGLHQICQHNY